jgi:hypothetical protein
VRNRNIDALYQSLGNILLGFGGSINRKLLDQLLAAMAYVFSRSLPTVERLRAPTIASPLQTWWLIPGSCCRQARQRYRLADLAGYAYAAIVGLSFIPWSIGVLPCLVMSPAILVRHQHYCSLSGGNCRLCLRA